MMKYSQGGKALTAQQKAMIQEVQDEKDRAKAEAAYNASLTSTEASPKKPSKPAKKMASGGYVRAADGCATKGKTKGTMVKMAKGGKTC